jgi:AraC-like DNA-binding protein
MKPSFEKLLPPEGSSIRCFNRAEIEKPVNWHYHPEIELTLVENGSGTRFVGDNIDAYCSGDLVLLGANLPHHWSSDEFRGQKYDRHPAIVVQFQMELFEGLLQTPEMNHIGELNWQAKRGLLIRGSTRDSVAASMKAMLNLGPFDRLIGLLHCLHALAQSQDVMPLASEGYSPTFRRKSQSRLHEIFEYINQNLANSSLSQADIARFGRMTPSALSRFFRNSTQQTIVDYVNERRIGMAARLLMETNLSILNICLRTGFENSSNFNRRFRQLKGMSPRDYRARYRDHMEVSTSEE